MTGEDAITSLYPLFSRRSRAAAVLQPSQVEVLEKFRAVPIFWKVVTTRPTTGLGACTCPACVAAHRPPSPMRPTIDRITAVRTILGGTCRRCRLDQMTRYPTYTAP